MRHMTCLEEQNEHGTSTQFLNTASVIFRAAYEKQTLIELLSEKIELLIASSTIDCYRDSVATQLRHQQPFL
jgi:hypothetical protein